MSNGKIGVGMSIGASIREQREALGMSQEDLARACMVSRQTISNWENGKTLPDIQSLTYLADAFNITVGDLIGGAGTEIVRGVSADRRELLLLNFALVYLALLSIAFRAALNVVERPIPDVIGAISYLIILLGLVGVVVRMGTIYRKHQLSTNQEIADYLVGELEYGAKPRGLLQRYGMEVTVLVVAIACLAAGVLLKLISG